MRTAPITILEMAYIVRGAAHRPLTHDESIKAICSELESYTAEIRADQDKITRHACAESVDELDEECVRCGGIYHQSANEAIINTKAI